MHRIGPNEYNFQSLTFPPPNCKDKIGEDLTICTPNFTSSLEGKLLCKDPKNKSKFHLKNSTLRTASLFNGIPSSGIAGEKFLKGNGSFCDVSYQNDDKDNRDYIECEIIDHEDFKTCTSDNHFNMFVAYVTARQDLKCANLTF